MAQRKPEWDDLKPKKEVNVLVHAWLLIDKFVYVHNEKKE